MTLPARFLQLELEGRQFLAGDQRIGDVVHEAGVAGLSLPGGGQSRGCGGRERRGTRTGSLVSASPAYEAPFTDVVIEQFDNVTGNHFVLEREEAEVGGLKTPEGSTDERSNCSGNVPVRLPRFERFHEESSGGPSTADQSADRHELRSSTSTSMGSG